LSPSSGIKVFEPALMTTSGNRCCKLVDSEGYAAVLNKRYLIMRFYFSAVALPLARAMILEVGNNLW